MHGNNIIEIRYITLQDPFFLCGLYFSRKASCFAFMAPRLRLDGGRGGEEWGDERRGGEGIGEMRERRRALCSYRQCHWWWVVGNMLMCICHHTDSAIVISHCYALMWLLHDCAICSVVATWLCTLTQPHQQPESLQECYLLWLPHVVNVTPTKIASEDGQRHTLEGVPCVLDAESHKVQSEPAVQLGTL